MIMTEGRLPLLSCGVTTVSFVTTLSLPSVAFFHNFWLRVCAREGRSSQKDEWQPRDGCRVLSGNLRENSLHVHDCIESQTAHGICELFSEIPLALVSSGSTRETTTFSAACGSEPATGNGLC